MRILKAAAWAALFVLLAVIESHAYAADATVRWDAGTAYSDGTPVPTTGPLATASFSVEQVACSSLAATQWAGSTRTTVAASARSLTITGLANDKGYCFRVYQINGAGISSDPSAGAFKLTPPAPPPDADADGVPDATDQCPTVKGIAPTGCPKPPAPTLVTVDTVAYEIVKGVDTLRLVARGTVAKGIACDAKQSANGLNVIPRASVVWTSAARPQVVVAKCAA